MWYAPYWAISVERLIYRRIQWIIIDSRVYDVSKFADLHPGGAAVLLVDSIGINPFPHHSIKAKVLTESMTLNSGERCHQSVLRFASAGSALPSSVRALADWHSQRQGTANQTPCAGRTFPSTLCGAIMAHAWLLQSIL